MNRIQYVEQEPTNTNNQNVYIERCKAKYHVGLNTSIDLVKLSSPNKIKTSYISGYLISVLASLSAIAVGSTFVYYNSPI